ncbi:MAG: response regulator [Phycisphaerae bacterium]|jgi:CheY-like chemotaxis protein
MSDERTTPSGHTILLVDDNMDFLTVNRSQLEERGFNVLCAESAKAAEEVLAAHHVDLAIVDMMLEHMDSGLVLCYHIKKNKSQVPVILVSAVASETGIEIDAATDEERSWVKADVMLTKPVRFEQLAREIDRLLEE